MQDKFQIPNLLKNNAVKERKARRGIKISWKVKLFLGITAVALLLFGAYSTVRAVNNFFDKNTFVFKPIVEFQFNKPLNIVRRIEKTETIVQVVNEMKELELNTPIEKYICEKFGAYDCKTAVAIARAESGLREEAVGINTNKTIDVGIFQINSVHFKREGCSLKELAIAEKNVDCAYQIWQEQGWEPWVVFNNGAFASQLEKIGK